MFFRWDFYSVRCCLTILQRCRAGIQLCQKYNTIPLTTTTLIKTVTEQNLIKNDEGKSNVSCGSRRGEIVTLIHEEKNNAR